jgi:hypothetical protein
MSSSPDVKIAPALASGVRFADERLFVAFDDGREISVPLDWFPRLANASEGQREDWRITAGGTAIRWAEIDEDIGVASLLGVPESLVEQAAGFKIHDIR